MPVVRNLWQRIYVAIATLSWGVFAACFLAHALLSYVGLWLADEPKLTDDPIAFIYFYMTTATTVGYGDLSPGTRIGRLIGVLVILPGSIALFTGFLGKAITDMSGFWRRRLQGLGDFSERRGHTLVVGWQGARTRRLVEGLVHDWLGERSVLLTPGVAENPMPDMVDFVAAQSIADLESFKRAGAAGAATLVVRGADDDETLAAILAATAAAPDAHIVVHFQDEGAAQLIRRQFPEVEVVTSIASGLLARAARDPGASRLAAAMFAGNAIDTAFSMKIPAGCGPLRYLDLFCNLKQKYELTLIGVGQEDGHVDLNCGSDKPLNPEDTLYYIADHRVRAEIIDWAVVCRPAVTA
jgi:voltage-gated potassium channel